MKWCIKGEKCLPQLEVPASGEVEELGGPESMTSTRMTWQRRDPCSRDINLNLTSFIFNVRHQLSGHNNNALDRENRCILTLFIEEKETG